MKIFVAGARGAIGSRLVPQLVARGHEVVGTSRTNLRASRLREQGARGVILDLLDRRAVREAVLAAEPEAIVHQATALAGGLDLKNFDRAFAETNRLRTEGTDALLEAAREAGGERFVAQSFAGWPYAREGEAVKGEDDPLDPSPVPAMRETLAAIRHLEQAVTGAGGIVLRYGGFYGAPDDAQVEAVRNGRFPIVGSGEGLTSFVHLEDAAAATVLALERGRPGIYNIVDDDPARVSEWLPALASVLGARQPRRVPRWLARLVAGGAAVALLTNAPGASNEKAKRELEWTLRYPSWRQGFAASYAADASAIEPDASLAA